MRKLIEIVCFKRIINILLNGTCGSSIISILAYLIMLQVENCGLS